MYKTKHYSAAEPEAFPRIDWFLDWALRGEDRRRREEGGRRKRNKSDRWTVVKCTKSMPFNGDYFFFLFQIFAIWKAIFAVPVSESQV